MTYNYAAKQQSALLQIQEKGQPVVLSKTTAGAFNDATGAQAAGTNTTYTVYGLNLGYKKKRFSPEQDSLVSGRVLKFLLDGVNTPSTLDQNYTLTVGGITYRISTVMPLAPGGVELLYEVELEA